MSDLEILDPKESGRWLANVRDMERGEEPEPHQAAEYVTLTLPADAVKHLHWLATKAGLEYVHELRRQSDDHDKWLADSRINGVALAVLTDKVRRIGGAR